MSQYSKNLGYEGEDITLHDYLSRGFMLIQQNFTMPGGEIDIILKKGFVLVFVEVKVVNHIDELHGYVTKKKLHYVRKTIDYFLLKEGHKYKDYDLRLDVVFVRHGKILEIYENVWVG